MATTAGASVPSYGISPSPETGGGSSEPCIVEEWLKTLNLARYAESFVDNGYDDLEICKQIGEPDLDAIGVSDPSHRQTILRAVRLLLEHGATAVYFTLEECQTQREECQQRDSTCLDAAKLDLEGADNYACEFGVNSGGESPPGNFAAANTFSRINRKYNDEYEEGKAELVRFPKLQLKVFIREKLIRDGIRLSSFPYTNADGSRGHLETLAVRYAHELRTHYQDVLERLEEVRRRRVAIDVVPYPSLNQQVEETYGRIKPLYKPGKYSPSSCLSDQEEETIYDNNYCSAIFRANNTAAPSINNCKSTNVASSPHTQRCVSPRSKLFYEPCPTEVRENGDNCVGEHSKKHRSGVTSGVLSGVGGGGLGKLFRSLGTKKDKGLSPKHKGSSAQISKASNYGFTLKLGGGHHTAAVPSAPGSTVDVNARAYQHAEISEPLVGDEERVQLLRMVRDGYLTMEEAVQKIRSRQAELAKDRKYPEVIAELTRGGLWGPGGRKTQPKPSSVFYSDQLNIPRSDPSLVEESHETPLHHSASLINASGHHPTVAEPSELLDRLSLRHHSPNPPLQKLPHYSSATLGTPSRRNTSATLERGTPPPRTFTQEEFAATVLARTRVTLGQRLSSSGETREPCSGECGNIMCSLSAATDEDSLIERPTDGERGSATTENGGNGSVVVCPGGEISPSSVDEPRFRSLSGVGEEGTAVTSDQPPPSEESNCFMIRERAPANSKSSTDGAGDYASSPVMERRSKSGVLGKFRNLTNRSSYSTSEEGHSQSSDCEDLDESRFSPRDSNNRASTTSFAGKVRDLHRDVKRRFGKLRGSSRSGDNENNRENGEAPIEGGSSMESIPSGSGGSRSSLQAHTPTSSNRSSSSAGEDETASVIGPILGRARALVDVTPSPYDRDALGLKKGDIIDIIAKNNTGTWVGVVKGKVGHFKFINVEEIAVESRARRRRRKERFNPARDNNLANSNSEQGYQDSLASPANERWQPETLEQLLNHFGLQGCMNVLMLHGYEDLNTFREIEKEDLSSLGITSPSLQKRLLRAAEVLFDDDEIDEGDEITNLENEDAIVENGNNRHSNEVVLSTNNLDAIDTGFVLSNFSSSSTSRHEVDDQSLSQDVREERQSDVPHSPRPSDFRPNIPASEPSSNERFATDENGIASSTIAFVASSQDELVSTDSGQGDSGESVRGSLRTAAKMLKASSICSVSGYDSEGSLSYSVRMEDFDFGRPDARMEIKNSKGKVPPPIPKRTTPTVVRPSKFPNGTVEVNCNGDAMVSYLYQDHDGYGIMVDSRAAKGVKSATLPRKKLMDANDSNQQQTQHSSSVVQEKVEHHGGSRLLEKKLYKKFGQRKGSLQTQALKNPRPPSLSLLTAVYRKLEDEGIDLGQEPYTDKTGFCGIPPALVQRYAEELQRDIYDVAESMDQARINSLQMRGRRGVPNDFLADACYGPVVEANYSGSLREWLISLGLPMYEEHLRLACMNRGLSHPLEKVAILRDSDLRNFGIRNARHVRLLTTAIGALNIHLGRLGGLC